MSKDILIMVPHRSAEGRRNEPLKNLIISWRETTSNKSDFLIGADQDDLINYPIDLPQDIILDINEVRLSVIKKINYLSLKYIKNYKYIYFVGNDCLFRTKNWENIFLNEAQQHKHVVFYGDDKLQGHKLATHAFMSTNIIEALGFMGPECLNHMFVDNFWMAVGSHLKCLKYFPNVILEHMHYANGKAEKDKMYESSDRFYDQDQLSFINYMRNSFLSDVSRIK